MTSVFMDSIQGAESKGEGGKSNREGQAKSSASY